MRKLLWTLGIVLGGAVAVFLTVKGEDGRPLWESVPVPGPEALPELSLPDVSLPFGGDDGDDPITVYKWRDEDGAWHFSDHPPEGVKAEAIEVRPRMVTPAPPPPPAPPATEAGKAGPATGALPFSGPLNRTRDATQALEARGEALKEQLEAAGAP